MAAAGAAPRGPQLVRIPKYSLMGPFRGHMSIKSSPFSPGSSCKLSTQYIIQDHMATHYRKLLSSKAAVDSSVPKSLHASIKYRDQQKKERLIKAVEKYKKELVWILSTTPFNCSSFSTGQQKWPDMSHLYMAPSRKVCSMTEGEQHSPLPFQKPASTIPSPVLTAREIMQGTVQKALSQTPAHRANTHKVSTAPLCVVACSKKKRFQNPGKKTYSEDLLEKHSDWFTEKNQPFTPQILKTSSQSSLSKYRYYNPPHKIKSISSGGLSRRSAETDSGRPRELRREEELKYLQFLQEVTNDLLIRRCYCRQAIAGIFQRHIRSRRHDLDEIWRYYLRSGRI